MEPSDFSSDASGQLVPTLDGRYLAFVPDPLPPRLELGAVSQRLLADASDAVGELRGMGRMLPHPALVTRHFARQEAVLSSRIEGTTADIEDLVLYQAVPSPVSARLDDVAEVANYQAALDLGLSLLDEMPFCNRTHPRGPRAAPPRRPRAGAPTGRVSTDSKCHRLPWHRNRQRPVHAAAGARNARSDGRPGTGYIGLRQDSTPLLVQLALIHYQFETIHPFTDDNGRVGRLIIPLLLHERGQLRHPLLYLSAFFNRHRDEYKDRLLAVSQHGAWEAWIAFFLKGVLRQATEAVSVGPPACSSRSLPLVGERTTHVRQRSPARRFPLRVPGRYRPWRR